MLPAPPRNSPTAPTTIVANNDRRGPSSLLMFILFLMNRSGYMWTDPHQLKQQYATEFFIASHKSFTLLDSIGIWITQYFSWKLFWPTQCLFLILLYIGCRR